MALKSFARTIGGHAFSYGLFATHRFKQAFACGHDIISVRDVLNDPHNQISAYIKLIQIGREEADGSQLSERDAAQLFQSLNDSDQAAVLKLFYSFIVQESIDDYLDRAETTRELAQYAQQETPGESLDRKPKKGIRPTL